MKFTIIMKIYRFFFAKCRLFQTELQAKRLPKFSFSTTMNYLIFQYLFSFAIVKREVIKRIIIKIHKDLYINDFIILKLLYAYAYDFA